MGLELGFRIQIIIAFFSLIVLVFGSQLVVEKMTAIAAYFNISDVVIAMSVISIGTSLPELSAHTIASIEILLGTLNYEIGSSTVLGANIGSDVVQQTLIVGLVILGYILINLKRSPKLEGGLIKNSKNTIEVLNETYFKFSTMFLKRDYLPMIGTTLMCIVLGWDGYYSRLDGAVLISAFGGYMYYLYQTQGDFEQSSSPSKNIKKDILIAIIAFSGVLISSHIVLDVSEIIVRRTGLGGSLIGVATIGVMSALPEFFTAISGVFKKAEGISLGTLIGSNITNPLLAIGFGSLLSTYWIPRPLVLWDLPMETITAALLLIYLYYTSEGKLGWMGGLYLVILYIFYLVIRVGFFAID